MTIQKRIYREKRKGIYTNLIVVYLNVHTYIQMEIRELMYYKDDLAFV